MILLTIQQGNSKVHKELFHHIMPKKHTKLSTSVILTNVHSKTECFLLTFQNTIRHLKCLTYALRYIYLIFKQQQKNNDLLPRPENLYMMNTKGGSHLKLGLERLL